MTNNYNFKFDDLIKISAKSTNFMFVPIAENNVKKIRVYIKTDKLDKDSTFQSIYTYYVSIQELADIIIMAHETNSLGKTYNALIKGKLKGCGFSGKGHRRKGFKESAHCVRGKFTYRNCIVEADNYGADNLFEQINISDEKRLNTDVYDEVFTAPNEKAFETAKLLAKKEGISVGISSGAALYGAIELAKRPENKGKTIVALLPDSGDRYYSTPLFTEE